jgi:tRNA (guanine26-N2/guanine27-N2)-dimethyltransferase
LFYFVPSKIAGHFHCQTPSLEEIASALLNKGFKVSRSHASPGSLKTNASNREIHDAYRSYIKTNPVRTEKLAETSYTMRLLKKEAETEFDFTKNPNAALLSNVKLVRYQENPAANWGPGKKATGKIGTSNEKANADLKRKREEDAMAIDGKADKL